MSPELRRYLYYFETSSPLTLPPPSGISLLYWRKVTISRLEVVRYGWTLGGDKAFKHLNRGWAFEGELLNTETDKRNYGTCDLICKVRFLNLLILENLSTDVSMSGTCILLI